MRYIWLDDIRQAPEGWEWVKTFPEFVIALRGSEKEDSEPITISLDHDLGDDDVGTGFSAALHIEEQAFHGRFFNIVKWYVHSANPVGAQRIRSCMKRFDSLKQSKPR